MEIFGDILFICIIKEHMDIDKNIECSLEIENIFHIIEGITVTF